MTITKTSSITSMGQPGWRPLTALAALVVLAHLLVLQAAPAQLGSGPDIDAVGATTLTTRRIETAPAPPSAPTASNIKATQNVGNKSLNGAKPQLNSALADPEIIANNAPIAAPEPAAEPASAVAAAPALATTTAAASPPGNGPAAPLAADSPSVATATPLQVGAQTTPVSAISLPGSVRLLYGVTGLSKSLTYQANSELAWKSNGDSYEAMMKVSAFLIGSRSMTSIGSITGSGLAPTRFADKFKAELAAHFDADKRKITFSANTPDVPWIDGAQDRVSVFFQLGGMLAANPSGFAAGSNITFLTIGPREADTWTFVIENEEDLDLMGAKMTTLKLTRKPRKEFDQKVEIWFAPSLGYLPVRNRVTQQNGDFIDQQLKQVVKG